MHTRAQSIALVGCSVLFTILLGVFGQSSIAQAQADNIDATVDASVTASITPDQLRMLTYTVPALGGMVVQFNNGAYAENAQQVQSALVEQFTAAGDLNNDGLSDAALILTTTVGESTFFDLAAVVNQGGGAAQNQASVGLGDRVRVDAVTIQNGVILVDLLMHGPNDAACCPTMPVKRAFILGDKQLIEQPAAAYGRLFPYRVGERAGYVNSFGQFVVPPSLVYAGDFSEGLALVSADGQRFGFINSLGQMSIAPQFRFATPFSSGVSVAALPPADDTTPLQVIYIDRTGANIFGDRTFQLGLPFSEGLAAVQDDSGKFGFIDRRGNLVIPPQFDFALSFAEGLAPVLVGDKVGYVDRTGRMVIEPQFDSAFDFSEGLAPVQVDGKVGYIGHNAEMVIAPQFERAREFSGGLAAVTKEGKEVYIDASGAVVIDAPDFANAGDFAEGLAAVKIGEGIGYIDQLGAVVIEPVFEQAEPFRDGMAVVQTDDLWGVIASDGTWLLQIAKPRLAASTEVTASTGMTFSAEVAAPLIAATQDVLSTEIVAFTPLVAPESRAGICYANSEIIALPSAWRCGVDNQVYDPCLTAQDGVTIVCGADPTGESPGFNVNLQEPLPAPVAVERVYPGALLFELENGAICRWNSGASVTIDGRRINYICSDLTQLLGEVDKSVPLWSIDQVTTSSDGQGNFVVTSSAPARIVRVWQPIDPTNPSNK
jgi:hypothetical protein